MKAKFDNQARLIRSLQHELKSTPVNSKKWLTTNSYLTAVYVHLINQKQQLAI